MSIIHNSSESELIMVDVGKVLYSDKNENTTKQHRFINNLGIGFDAYVGKLNQQNKVFSGISSYIYSVIKALFNYKMIDIEVYFNEKSINEEKLMLSIGNGISSGGGFYLNPHALINDGQLDISIFDKITRRRLLTALPLALLNKIDSVPEAKQSRTERIKLKLRTPYYAHCDGEIISEQLEEATISVDKQFLRVIKKVGK
jgi:diacylglycerol kinase family enzyme